jgi:hypothetical protein
MAIVFGAFQVPLVLFTLPFWTLQARMWQTQSLTSPPALPSMDQFVWLAAAGIGLTAAALVLGTFGAAGIAHIVRRARTGDRPAAREVFQALRRDAGAVLGLVVVMVAGFLVICLTFVVVGLALLAVAGPAGIGVAVLATLVAGVLITVGWARLALAIPALAVERRGPVNAFRRSWALVAGSTLRTFGILVLGSLVVGVAAGLLNPVFLPDVAAGLATGSVLSYAIIAVVAALAQTLFGPVLPTVLTVVYFDYAAEREVERAG